MKNVLQLEAIIPESGRKRSEQLALFAFINLGVVDSLTAGLLSADDAVRLFFTADNCLFVRRQLRDRTADRIMSHGAQLADLFDILPPGQARREFRRELETMRSLCRKLLERKRSVA